MSKSKRKSRGTIIAEETRAATNKLTRSQRDKLLASAMRIIYGQTPKGQS